MTRLREAIEASWSVDTAYLGAHEEGNPALGNCYPTSRVLQHFFPKMEVIEGIVRTGKQDEKHFWNMLIADGVEYHIDLTWPQFPHGSIVKEYKIRDRETFGDSEPTVKRIDTLLTRVTDFLEKGKE